MNAHASAYGKISLGDDTVNVEVITNPTGVPISFSKTSSASGVFLIQNGQLNVFSFRPRVLNEHCEPSVQIQDTVRSGKMVGQIFRASSTNINGINLSLASAGQTMFDDFESYANDAALQAVWVESGGTPVTLSTAVVSEGTQSMEFDLGASVSDEWQSTISSTNYTGVTFSLDYRQTVAFANASMEFFLGDGTNTKSFDLTITVENQFQSFSILEEAMVDDGGTPPTMTAITEVGFRLTNRQNNQEAFVDNIETAPLPGSVAIQLWDMGSVIPVAGVTSLDDGVRYDSLGDISAFGGAVTDEFILNLVGGIRRYPLVNFLAGVAYEIPDNKLIVDSNYYAITINYTDTDVLVLGGDSALGDCYKSGFSFTATDTTSAITGVGDNSDISFLVYSSQAVYATEIFQTILNTDGTLATIGVQTLAAYYIMDSTQNISQVVAPAVIPSNNAQVKVEFRPMFMPLGGKAKIEYNDDANDTAFIYATAIAYVHEPSDAFQ